MQIACYHTHMHTQEDRFLDQEGRILLPRGCNLGGDSKVPIQPNGRTTYLESLDTSQTPSFTGRPFPLEEADRHFSFLSQAGFNFLRMVIPWEAIEPTGPGVYDETYLAYLRKILKKAGEYDFSILIDPHQDVWSRWCGGDGAPLWTLASIGINPEAIEACGAAIRQQSNPTTYTPMLWPSNYSRYASATMFSLFFASHDLAPHCTHEDQALSMWLQERYIAAWRHLYRRIKDCKNVVAFEVMNEPHHGFIGQEDIRLLGKPVLQEGPMPTPLQAMAATKTAVPSVARYHTDSFGIHKKGTTILNEQGQSLFQQGFSCPWEQEGVWTIENGVAKALKPNHFFVHNDRPINFTEDYLKPFTKRFMSSLHEARDSLMIFIDSVPGSGAPTWHTEDGPNCVNAFHWYDGYTLIRRRYSPLFNLDTNNLKPLFGHEAQVCSAAEQMNHWVNHARTHMANIPSFLGEFGIPFNMKDSKSFETGDYQRQEKALSICYEAIERLLIPHTIWNFTASNHNEDGDGWNTEDLSIWNADMAGPRASGAWIRPWPLKTAGIPIEFTWNREKFRFTYTFDANPAITAPTVISIPDSLSSGLPRFELFQDGKRLEDPTVEKDRFPARWNILLQGVTGRVCLKGYLQAQ